ncbi:MAG TPA: alpha-L-fucosidase, partial [Anaerolineae bacterium]
PGLRITFQSLQAAPRMTVQLLGHAAPLTWQQEGNDLIVTLPPNLPEAAAQAFKMTPAPQLVE